jgi:uncharacterized phage protein gp47/JayE
MSYGLTPEGFNAKPLETIKTEIEDDFRVTFGAEINLQPRSNMGQFIGIMSEPLAELWELLEALYIELTADGATGAQLDNLSALTGTVRDPPKRSRVIGLLTGTAGTVVPAGSVASVAGTGTRFALGADTTIFEDGTEAEFVAVDTGQKVCPAGTLTVISTPVAGWDAVTNAADAFELGTDLETDAALRIRREQELRARGNAALEPIRQEVIEADETITQCVVFANDTDAVDADGLPPHSIEVLVQGGAANAIAQAILDSKAAGIQTYGNTSGTAFDGEGEEHTVYFSRPTVVPVYVGIEVAVLGDEYPIDGDDQIKAALVLYGDTRLTIGSDVIPSALSAQAFKVSGVDEVTGVFVGTTPSPVGTTRISIGPRQLADLDTSRISVAS